MQVPVLVNICPVSLKKNTCICSVTYRCTRVWWAKNPDAYRVLGIGQRLGDHYATRLASRLAEYAYLNVDAALSAKIEKLLSRTPSIIALALLRLHSRVSCNAKPLHMLPVCEGNTWRLMESRGWYLLYLYLLYSTGRFLPKNENVPVPTERISTRNISIVGASSTFWVCIEME